MVLKNILSDTYAIIIPHKVIQTKMEVVHTKLLWRVKKREEYEWADVSSNSESIYLLKKDLKQL